MKRLAASLFSRFRTSERGAILVEALLVIPVITAFAVAVVEFGYVFWERQQMAAGVRDAARYWSRCSLKAYNSTTTVNGQTVRLCSVDKARLVATTYYDPADAKTYQRLTGWSAATASAVTITPAVPPANPTIDDVVTVTGLLEHNTSPLFVLLNLKPIGVEYTYKVRYLGW